MTSQDRTWPAVSALGAIVVVTAVWWALALWPVASDTPSWVMRTRAACFGTTLDGLPNAGGWLLLLGQPLGMLTVLLAVWPREVRAGLARMATRMSGQLLLGAGAALVVASVVLATVRILDARGEPFSVGARDLASALTPIDDPAPAIDLVDQHGRAIATTDFDGRVVFVTFAYAHCETVCPTVVSDVVAAARQLEDRNPAVVVVTLDPWRDTPARLPGMADAWRLPADAHVLSGPVDRVERVLNAWRLARVRNTETGALSHPSIVYVVGPNGRIRYVTTGGSDLIAAAAKGI